MEVEIKKEAKKDLRALDGIIRQQIADDILKLIHFPETTGVKRLKGKPIKYRLRFWCLAHNFQR